MRRAEDRGDREATMRATAGTKLSRGPARGGPTALLNRARGALTERRPPRRGRRALNEPSSLWLLRHGQSEGNVIRDRAAPDLQTLDIAERDMDVPLSALGRAQAEAFGRWLAGRHPEAPEVVVASPWTPPASTSGCTSTSACENGSWARSTC